MSFQTPQGGRTQSRALIEHIESYENIQFQIDGLKEHQKQILSEARQQGWDMRGFKELIKLRKLSQSEREDWEAIRQLMLHEVGMLGDTPLGGAALRRFEQAYQPHSPQNSAESPQQAPEPPEANGADATHPQRLARPTPPAKPAGPTPEEIAAQRQAELDEAEGKGTEAGELWKKSKSPAHGILSNPFLAMDPRRVKWDAAWRAAADSDGMELPAYLRRADKPRKPKKGGHEANGKGGE